MSSEMQIYINKPNKYYVPGETIVGRIECNFNSKKTVRGIFIKFKAICSTSWTEQESYDDVSSYVTYKGEEIYFYREFNVLGTDITVNIPSGKHIYPFSYKLPQQIPTSYEDAKGWANVRYTIIGKIDRPWKFNIESLAVFNVMSPLDLNSVPGIREPVKMALDKTLWINNDGGLMFGFTLPTVGYTPGQNVELAVYVKNLTKVNVEMVRFKITKLTEYITKKPSKKVKKIVEVIAESFDGGIGAHSEKSWTASLHLPLSKSYPNMNPCRLINISYRLTGVVQIPFPHTNLTAYVPLTIGHIPLLTENVRVPSGIVASAPPFGNASLSTTYGGELGLPTYDEAMKLKCNSDKSY